MSERTRIRLFQPLVVHEAATRVADVLRSGWLGPGPRVVEFEQRFAEYVGAEHCVAVGSGTDAVRLALHALDLPHGSEVVTTPVTFVSVNQAIVHEGLVPVFADVQPDTGSIDPSSVERLVGERTGALLVMHYGGRPCDLDELRAIARDAGIAVIEDAAHACGAVYRGVPIGSRGICAFSFGAIKNLALGAGGAVTVDTPALAARLRRLRNAGIETDSYQRARAGRHWDYDVVELGFRCSLSDVVAAVGLAQLPSLPEANLRRAAIARRYRTALAGVPGVELLRDDDDRVSSHHLFAIAVDGRDRLVEYLDAAGVDAGVYYRPSYHYPPFERRELPGVEAFWRRVVCLPLHLALEDEDVDRVVELVEAGW